MARFSARNRIASVFAATLLGCFSLAAHADETFLTVTGNITKGGPNHKWTLTQKEFDALPQHNVATSTSWTQGVHTFTGPLLRDVQKLAGATSANMTAYAVDDYLQKIPTADFTKYDVIIADRMDGHTLPMDKYGPMWIIYPRDSFPSELKNPMTDGKFVWQINRVDFK